MSFDAFDLRGRVALVTGGNSGIGFGMADALSQAGADVAIWGRDPAKMETSVARLQKHGGRVLGQRVDVTVEEEVVTGMRELLDELGRVDAIFANAGGGHPVPPFLELGPRDHHSIMAQNLDGTIWTFREGARHMVDRAARGDAGGSLVVTSSIASVHGSPRSISYAASKAALLALVRSLAVDLARHGIRANAILPGWISTAGPGEKPGFDERVLRRVPARRWGTPDDFGGIAVYLASDASRYHSGDSIVIDGAYTVF